MKISDIVTMAGQTDDDQRVLKGVFALTGTHGIPLEVVLGILKTKSIVIDWMDWILAATGDGWTERTIKARINSAVKWQRPALHHKRQPVSAYLRSVRAKWG